MNLDELGSGLMLSSDERITLDKIAKNQLLSEFERTVADRLVHKGVLSREGDIFVPKETVRHWRF